MSLEDRFDDFLSEYREDRGKDQQFQGEMRTTMKSHGERLNDHGNRLRSLEKLRYWVGGIGATLGALIVWPKFNIKLGP